LTSQDINNTAIPLQLKHAMESVYYKSLREDVLGPLEKKAKQWLTIPMLARTHGQPATPTRVGKELMVFVERIANQLSLLEKVPYSAKFGGATGQFNASYVAFPHLDWPKFADNFIQSLGLTREQYTTQISHYDNIAALFDGISRINTILLDMCRDIWQYISMNYFKLQVVKAEVGSSAMPHKVNPIDFENAEGNLGLANAVFHHMSSKLPISRLQRDLSDSTVLRNIGVPLAYTIIAFKSLGKGLSKIDLNEAAILGDLELNYVVVSEAIQTILRREEYPEPYEALKALTRTGDKITKQSFEKFIDELAVSDTIKQELKQITPFNFIGVLPK